MSGYIWWLIVVVVVAIIAYQLGKAVSYEERPAEDHPDIEFDRIELALKKLGDRIVGAFEDLTAAVKTTVPDVTAAIQDLVTAGKAGNGLTPDQIQAATDATAALNALDAAAKAADPGAPPPAP